MSRTSKRRVEDLVSAVDRGREFLARVETAAGDVLKCADLMAEAIAIDRESRSLEPVGLDGRTVFSMEELQACYCLDAAREAYLLARGSNQ